MSQSCIWPVGRARIAKRTRTRSYITRPRTGEFAHNPQGLGHRFSSHSFICFSSFDSLSLHELFWWLCLYMARRFRLYSRHFRALFLVIRSPETVHRNIDNGNYSLVTNNTSSSENCFWPACFDKGLQVEHGWKIPSPPYRRCRRLIVQQACQIQNINWTTFTESFTIKV